MYLLIFAVGFISAVILLFIMFFTSNWYRVRRQKKKNMKEQSEEKQKKSGKKVKIDTYVKATTAIVLAHGLVMVTMSYVLAWFEKDAVVDVSTTLITEIVAPLCLYMGTNCIMNIFEKNKLSFSTPIQMRQVVEAWNKVCKDMEDESGGNAAG